MIDRKVERLNTVLYPRGTFHAYESFQRARSSARLYLILDGVHLAYKGTLTERHSWGMTRRIIRMKEIA